jgi:hypothetical protein
MILIEQLLYKTLVTFSCESLWYRSSSQKSVVPGRMIENLVHERVAEYLTFYAMNSNYKNRIEFHVFIWQCIPDTEYFKIDLYKECPKLSVLLTLAATCGVEA